MNEGQYQSPLTAPALIAMMTNYLFGSYRIRGSHSGGGETAVSVQVFLDISYEKSCRGYKHTG